LKVYVIVYFYLYDISENKIFLSIYLL